MRQHTSRGFPKGINLARHNCDHIRAVTTSATSTAKTHRNGPRTCARTRGTRSSPTTIIDSAVRVLVAAMIVAVTIAAQAARMHAARVYV